MDRRLRPLLKSPANFSLLKDPSNVLSRLLEKILTVSETANIFQETKVCNQKPDLNLIANKIIQDQII